jgi:hypothetical protein
MSTGQPDDTTPDELDDDAGVNAIRLDAERARDDLDKTLAEIERRLDPQRVIQPVKRTVQRTVATIRSEYHKDPVRFVTVTVLTVSAVGAILTWAGGGLRTGSTPTSSTRAHRPSAAQSPLDEPRSTQGRTRPAKPTKPSKDPVLRNANKISKRAVASVIASRL